MEGNSQSTDTLREKILSVDALKSIIGEPPRASSVIMCHGTFDIVHPGHLRHLMYAKEHAGILVVSITCDAHITKANLRPFVPQELRALNLAALTFVDYVIIDENNVPIENILYLKPDLFAKGFDYVQAGIPEKTQAEIAAVDTYGGEILFTPGDIVFSSSAFIEASRPKIAAEKLEALMKSENITFQDIRNALRKIQGTSVHVIGDTIVDTYTQCITSGGSAKTPTLSVLFDHEKHFCGGAAVVAKHLKAAGGDVHFSTVLGNDPLMEYVLNDLEEAEIITHAIVDPTRPTVQKNVFLSQGYHLLRMNRVDNRTVSERIVNQLSNSLREINVDAVVFSDFRHGIFNRNTIPTYMKNIPNGVFTAADSQVATRWGNILEFVGCNLITPNEREARFALGDQDSVVRSIALELFKRSKSQCLILTMGERGIMTFRNDASSMRDYFTIDTFAEQVVDAVGSGDALLSYATLALCATKSEIMASLLGAFAAAVACEREGNFPVQPEEVLAKIEAIQSRIEH